MFHVSWNAPNRGTSSIELLELATQAVRSALPDNWNVSLQRDRAPAGEGQADARLRVVAPDGTSSSVLVELKGVVVPRDVARVAARLSALRTDATGGAMLVAPFLSPTTRRQLDRHDLGWFDPTGNLRLKLDRPAVFVERIGADRSGFRDPADRLLKSLRGPAAAKVVVALSEVSPPVGVRELADQARVGAATSARVLGLLHREAVVERGDNGVVTATRKRSLVDRWTVDYRVMTSNEVLMAVDPRGIGHALSAPASMPSGVAVTGSVAARAYLPADVVPVAPPASLSVYAEEPLELMGRLGLKRVERGTNVLVMQPYDQVVLATARPVGGLVRVAPIQVVADLATGPGRSGEGAEQLIAALAVGDPGWTS